MPTPPPVIRIGIYGSDRTSPHEKHGCRLWPAGYAASVTAAGGTPVLLDEVKGGQSLDELVLDLHGVVLAGTDAFTGKQTVDAEWLCDWCKKQSVPLLAIDHGLHALNTIYGGTMHLDLPRELPEALQHRHPPEKGLRHAINVEPKTRLCDLYGEGEIVVNSEHRTAVCRVAKGFRVSARALDSVIEAIEAESKTWFALAIQWQPASSTASGLDIQVFRGLIEACRQQSVGSVGTACLQAA